jgi:class 3 adenylate cyclase/predicted ATPase
MRCESCGTVNAVANRFCGQCGSGLPLTCDGCGSEVPAGQLFCGHCGARSSPARETWARPAPASVDTVAAGPAGPEPVPELRWASVIFVDLVGYTPMTEGRDPEDVRELLMGYFDVADTIVDRHGGRVEKFIGDAVVAAWGSRSSREDDAARCVRAGLEIVDAVAAYGERRGLPGLTARAGVVTGHVVAWDSVEQGLVAGDRVNLAARVQAEAEPGTVLVDETTMRATQSTVAFRSAGERTLKGVAEPTPLWRAMRVLAGDGELRRRDSLETTFVGRGRELTTVKELFHRTVDSGRAGLVTVSGVAGIGKTRLSREFETYVEGLAGRVFWHRGRCLSWGDGVAFWALAEMVRFRFDISDDDPADVAMGKLTEGLLPWVPDAEERAFIAPRLGVLVAAVDREFSRDELFAGWRLFLERLAMVHPVVLVVEDLHWADTGLLDFVEYLLDWSAGVPIFMVGLTRPELAERRPGWLADQPNASLLHLEPLPETAIRLMLDEMVPGLPDQAKDKISAHAGGVPLYAVETVRSLMDRDLVVFRDGAHCLEGVVEDLDVPASLTALISARLDELPSVERELVKGLAVLGETFSRRAVSAVSDAPEEELNGLLRTLVRREVLTVRSDPLVPDRDDYMFVQGMLRSVAHDTLTRRELKRRHREVADHLRAAFPEGGLDVTELIATHLLRAYVAAGTDPEAQELRTETERAFERAAARAAAVGSPDAAGRHFQTAADLADDEETHTRLVADAAIMAERAGRPADALALIDAAADAHREAGREVAAARLVASAGWTRLNFFGQPRLTLQQLEDALVVLERHAVQDELPMLHAVLASACTIVDSHSAAAAEHVERCLVLAAALDDHDALMAGFNTKAEMLIFEHRVVEATATFRAGVALAREWDDTYMDALARGNLGRLLLHADVPEAKTMLQSSMDLSKRLGDALMQAEGAIHLGWLHLALGQWDRTEGYGTGAVELSAAAHLPDGRLLLLTLLTARGELGAAEEHLAEIEALTDIEDPGRAAELDLARGVVAFARGDLARARELLERVTRWAHVGRGMLCTTFRQAWPLAVEISVAAGEVEAATRLMALVEDAAPGHVPPYLRAQLRRLRALTAAAVGSQASVEEDLSASVEAFGELAYPYWHARAQLDLAAWLSEQDRGQEGTPLLADAADTFARLGAQPDLGRVRLLQNVQSAT